ncbi:hypothetical protein P3L10_021556 [Capsicum annuum]
MTWLRKKTFSTRSIDQHILKTWCQTTFSAEMPLKRMASYNSKSPFQETTWRSIEEKANSVSYELFRNCYVSSTNEYKIVVSFERSLPGAAWEPYAYFEDFLHFKILTVKLDEELSVEELSWRDLLSRTEYSGTYHQPIHINGFVFWLLYAEDNSNIYFETGNSSDRMDILEMNLENEEIKTICCPNGCSFGYSHLAEINGTYMCYSE